MNDMRWLKFGGLFSLAGSLVLPALLFADAPETLRTTPATSPTGTAKDSGEIGTYVSSGTYKGKLPIGKIDPPAAFNLEDIQNFPEERLHPVLNNPVNFEEGRDFSALMDFQDDKVMHPWIPDFPRAPFLTMRGDVDSSARDWTFSIIDQAAGAIYTQSGKGNPPQNLAWNGEDQTRGYVAIDTVYIPQISITNKEGYHRTYPGQPAQFTAIRYDDKGKTVIELSSKALFQEHKADFSKEGELLMEKVTDLVRESGKVPFTIQPYDSETDLARMREQALAKYLQKKLYVSESQIVQAEVAGPEKRGNAFGIVLSATGGVPQ